VVKLCVIAPSSVDSYSDCDGNTTACRTSSISISDTSSRSGGSSQSWFLFALLCLRIDVDPHSTTHPDLCITIIVVQNAFAAPFVFTSSSNISQLAVFDVICTENAVENGTHARWIEMLLFVVTAQQG
jgi:hypothetical protein